MSKKYSFDIKLEAVKMYLEKGIGPTNIARQLELSDRGRVMLWVRRYKEFGEDGLKERRGKATGPSKGRAKKEDLTLEEKIKRLEAENEYLKKVLKMGR